MKNNIFVIMLAIATLVALSVPQADAVERSLATAKTRQKKATPTILKATGKVTGYNWSNSMITISASSGITITITADKNTAITKAGKAINLADIRRDDVVMVTYETKGGVNVAKTIVVQIKPSSSGASDSAAKKN